MALISLDVFDTAIFRKVFKPTDIFCVVEDEVGHNFYNLRIEAQNKARRVSIFYNIFDIYKYIPQFDLKEEIKAEYSNCYANPYILEMYNNSNDEFIFISDMYLPEKVIVGMLERCGYKNPKVFVSCDYKAVKSDGKLFKVVEEAIGRKIDKHIGDNYNCDIIGAKRARINETEYIGPTIYNKEVVTPELDNVKLRKLLIDEELSNNDIAEKIGYLFAPLTLAFTKSVLDEAKDDQTIFFNARDSFLMYIVARWILKTKKKIKYCRFSRKSCQFPNINVNRDINSPQNEKVRNFFRSLRIETIRDFIDMFDLKGDYSKELEQLNIDLDTNIALNNDRSLILLKFISLIQKDIYNRAIQERQGILEYISKIGMKDKDIFVDLGHFGSMQSIIHKITGFDLKGRYVHTLGNDSYFKGVIEDKTSFLPHKMLYSYTGIVELVYSEPVGTVISYNNGIPILNRDFKYRKGVVKSLLKGTLRGVRDLVRDNIRVSVEDCALIVDRFLKQPTYAEARFGNSKLFENGSCKDNESIVWYETDLIKRGKLKECYNRSYWKTAFKVLLENDNQLKHLKGLIK